MRTAADIKADLDAAYEARRTALSAQSYSFDSGQGKQQVQRADLGAINKTIRELENLLAEAESNEAGESGLLAPTFRRF